MVQLLVLFTCPDTAEQNCYTNRMLLLHGASPFFRIRDCCHVLVANVLNDVFVGHAGYVE